jgi:hypothetical protein
MSGHEPATRGGVMSVSYMQERNTRAGHEVLRSSGVVICYRERRQAGQPVKVASQHWCPFCRNQVFTYAS